MNEKKLKKTGFGAIETGGFKVEDFIGSKEDFKGISVKQFTQGELDFTTLKKRIPTKFDFQKALNFIKSEPRIVHSTLFNLCSVTYGFSNFENLGL